MEIVDRKFRTLAVNPCNGKIYTEENSVLFCAKDLAFLDALPCYLQACVDRGANDAHIESVKLLIGRVRAYQENVECRVPDTIGNCEIDRCVGGKI